MDTNIQDFDPYKNCRVCLSMYSQMVKLFDDDHANSRMLQDCCKVEIEESDGLPEVICEFCEQEMLRAYKFITKCKLTDNKLRIFIDNRKQNVEDEELRENKHWKQEYLEDDVIEDADSFPIISFCKLDETLPKKSSQRHKKKKHDKTYPKQCSQCSLILKTESSMVIHMRTHTNERPYQCCFCGKCFKTKGVLKAHMIVHDNKEKFMKSSKELICDYCKKIFHRKNNLVTHLRIHTGETPYSCKYCSRTFSQISNLIRHRKLHTGEKPYSCHICQKKFYTLDTVKKHAVTHSTERRFSCTDCSLMFKTKECLKAHVAVVHKNSKSVVCEKCGIFFSTPGNLRGHIKKVHSKNSGHCYHCNKDFSNIMEHSIQHSGETPYECDTCGKKFSTPSRLKIHIRKHIHSDKYSCEYANCTKKFTGKSMLGFHILKYHKKETPYTCKYCKRGFYRISDLTRHLKLNHSDNPNVIVEIKKVQSEERNSNKCQSQSS